MGASPGDSDVLGGLREILLSLGASEELARGADVEENLFDQGILNSVSVVGLILKIEERFGVKLPSSEIEPSNFSTLGALAHLVSRCLPGARGVANPPG